MLNTLPEIPYGELEFYAHHIDYPILALIVKMNCLKFIRTNFSCGGHYSLEGIPHLYHYGIDWYVNNTDPKGLQFMQDIEHAFDEYPFEYLSRRGGSGRSNEDYWSLAPQRFSLPCFGSMGHDEATLRHWLEEAYRKTYVPFHALLEEVIDKTLSNVGNQPKWERASSQLADITKGWNTSCRYSFALNGDRRTRFS